MDNQVNSVKRYRAVILDLDGCMYVGDKPISGSSTAVSLLRERGIKILYLTNNSTQTSEDYAFKLGRMGVESTPEEILTSGEAASLYILRESGPSKILPLTEKGFIEYAMKSGHVILGIDRWMEADYVVVGLDRDLTYTKLKAASRAVMRGARFVATNLDPTVPSGDGLDPGAGAIAAGIAKATGIDPILIGKPSRIIMDMAFQRISLSPRDVLVVGDRLDTDILAGKVVGADTALLLSGATSREVVDTAPPKDRPDYVAENLLELCKMLVSEGLL